MENSWKWLISLSTIWNLATNPNNLVGAADIGGNCVVLADVSKLPKFDNLTHKFTTNQISTGKMIKSSFTLFAIILTSTLSFGQTAPEVIVPNFDDKFCNYVRQLEAGLTDIDYQDFRFSFIESEQFKIASNQSNELDSLKKEMYVQINQSNYPEIIKITKQMLSIDYTSMIAHKILRQTYKIIGDTIHAAKYKTIQFGLLNSIVKKGDGKTCETAWPVIQIEEEYFILEMLDAKLQKQSIDKMGGLCDKMEVKIDGNAKTYFFETSKVFEGYKKLGIK